MTTITTPNPIEALEASPIPFDLYREVHKGLRLMLFQLTAAVGSTDCESAEGRAAVAEKVGAMLTLLHAHHHHEDAFIQELIVAHDPPLAAIVDAGHEETEADLEEIVVRTDALVAADGGEAVALGLDLYRFLALFTARYLAHMALEEGGVMTALRDAMSVAELFEVEMALRGAVPPPRMCEFIAVMVPAMNPAERAAMLGGMQAAPPEVFELFRAAAEAALAPSDYQSLAVRIGLA